MKMNNLVLVNTNSAYYSVELKFYKLLILK